MTVTPDVLMDRMLDWLDELEFHREERCGSSNCNWQPLLRQRLCSHYIAMTQLEEHDHLKKAELAR